MQFLCFRTIPEEENPGLNEKKRENSEFKNSVVKQDHVDNGTEDDREKTEFTKEEDFEDFEDYYEDYEDIYETEDGDEDCESKIIQASIKNSSLLELELYFSQPKR